MDDQKLLNFFKEKTNMPNGDKRYWWFKLNQRLPIFFSYFSGFQKQVLCDWYNETDKTGSGECNYPLIGMLIGLLGTNPGSNLKMVQLGHYNGFSSLLIGFIYNNIQVKGSFFSIDISKSLTEQANKWVTKANLDNYVKQIVGDSADPKSLVLALKYLQTDEINILFIDSSHAYEHTKKELALWFPKIKKGGFIFLHDTSIKARQSNGVGVYDAFKEFCKAHEKELVNININSFVEKGKTKKEDLLYQDGCGLGIIQKI